MQIVHFVLLAMAAARTPIGAAAGIALGVALPLRQALQVRKLLRHRGVSPLAHATGTIAEGVALVNDAMRALTDTAAAVAYFELHGNRTRMTRLLKSLAAIDAQSLPGAALAACVFDFHCAMYGFSEVLLDAMFEVRNGGALTPEMLDELRQVQHSVLQQARRVEQACALR